MTHSVDAIDDRAPGSRRRWRRRVLLVAIPAVATLMVFTFGVLAGRQLGDPQPDGVTAAEPGEPGEPVTVTVAPTPDPSPPTRLLVPSLAIDAPVVDIDLGTDAVLEPPVDPDLVGYWTGSAKVGASVGRTVITGHTVQSGNGALDELPDLKPGATVQLASYSGLHSYRVTDNLYVTYEEVAKHAQDIFGQTEERPGGGARLILVTCTEFNGRFYEGNSIVVAEPIDVDPPDAPTATPTAEPTATDPAAASQDPTSSEPEPDQPASTPPSSGQRPTPAPSSPASSAPSAPSVTATPRPTSAPSPTSSPTTTSPPPSPSPTPSPTPSSSPSAAEQPAPRPRP